VPSRSAAKRRPAPAARAASADADAEPLDGRGDLELVVGERDGDDRVAAAERLAGRAGAPVDADRGGAREDGVVGSVGDGERAGGERRAGRVADDEAAAAQVDARLRDRTLHGPRDEREHRAEGHHDRRRPGVEERGDVARKRAADGARAREAAHRRVREVARDAGAQHGRPEPDAERRHPPRRAERHVPERCPDAAAERAQEAREVRREGDPAEGGRRDRRVDVETGARGDEREPGARDARRVERIPDEADVVSAPPERRPHGDRGREVAGGARAGDEASHRSVWDVGTRGPIREASSGPGNRCRRRRVNGLARAVQRRRFSPPARRRDAPAMAPIPGMRLA
jgi:hypothetical protein